MPEEKGTILMTVACTQEAAERIAAILSQAGGETIKIRLPIDLEECLWNVRVTYIRAALHQAGHNMAAAARLLGMKRTTLAEWMKRHKKDL